MRHPLRKFAFASAGVLLAVGVAFAATNAEKCIDGRVKALTRYDTCMQKLLAKAYLDPDIDQTKFSKCRERYAQAWDKLGNLTGTICDGVRWEDNGDQTVTDNLTGLVWEKKGSADATPNPADPNDVDNVYTWTAVDGDNADEDGSLFTSFLAPLNASNFGGASGWRVPTVVELQSILLSDPFPCATSPCIDPTFGPTQPVSYWSTTSGANGLPTEAWDVDFATGCVNCHTKTEVFPARAVRGGLF
jgi:hypothetical protein